MHKDVMETEQNLFSYNSEETSENDTNTVLNEKIIKDKFLHKTIQYDPSYNLKIEAFLLSYAYAYNKIMSLSNSRTRILSHQVECTHIIVNAFKQRFLIADEVGLGKTIEAGLVIKELIYRYNYNRILIVCPASLLLQWQSELESKFNEAFTIMDRKNYIRTKKNSSATENPWNKHKKVICSLDFIKNPVMHDELSHTNWDIIIFDESHRLRRDSKHTTQGYTIAEIISQKTKALLLLSATPFRGKLEELYYLIALIDKNILGPFNSFYNEYCLEQSDLSTLKYKLEPVIIRRTKKEIGGFTKRHAMTIKFELYPEERALYDETTIYVINEFNRAMQNENRAVGFVMTVFQKLLDSSSFALLSALKNRAIRLEELLNRNRNSIIIKKIESFDHKTEDEHNLNAYNTEKSIHELKEEIKTLHKIIKLAEKISINKKGEKLLELLKNLKDKGYKKFLIFTQFRTTQDYLQKLLSNYTVEIFNGSMSKEEKEEAILGFKNDKEILIATESGGEGRNMQFASILINYDLPWSPLKIEQRIGRIHRFGQKNDVLVYNFSTADTVAERILEVLTEKLRLFEESIGSPDILLGEIEDELQLNSLFMNLANKKLNKNEIENELDTRVDRAKQNFKKLEDLTVTNRMDFNYDEYYKITLKERQFSNNRLEKFIQVLQECSQYPFNFIGHKQNNKDLYPIRNYKENNFTRFGTFRSEVALENEQFEFLAFGHPIIDTIISHCKSEAFNGTTGISFMKYHTFFIGLVCNFIVEFKSTHLTHQIIPIIGYNRTDFLNITSLDLEDMEREFLEQILEEPENHMRYKPYIESIQQNFNSIYNIVKDRLLKKINAIIIEITDNLDITLDPEIEKVKTSYQKRIKELDDKLSLQEGQMKWYGKDMKSAITRTKNKIMKAEREMNTILDTYKSYSGITYSIKLLNCGILIATT